jgi:hypothetical protein
MIACKLCVLERGLRLDSPHCFDTVSDFYKHLKVTHNIHVEYGEEQEMDAKDYA